MIVILIHPKMSDIIRPIKWNGGFIMVKRAACYCRVSTKKEEQLASMAMQKEFFTEYCKRNKDLEMYQIYADEGISGKSLKNRKQFDKMINDAKRGCFDVILVKDISRFARNTVDLLTTIRMLKDMGIGVYFVNYNMDNLGDSELVITMLGALAQEESAALSKKLKLSKNMTAERGRVPNFVFGYDRVDKYTLTLNKNEAEWVRKIFDLYVNEGMGAAKIAEYLNVNNVITKKKNLKRWTQHVISMMLRNELYIGKVINKKSEVTDFKTGKRKQNPIENYIIVERPEFRIVDDVIFDKAKRLLASRCNSFHLDKRRPSNKHPLSNLMVCANDGYSFRRCSRQYSENGKIYSWWTCSYRNGKGTLACNNNIKIDEAEMHSAISEFLQTVCGEKEDIMKQVKEYVEKELKRRYDNIFNIKELSNELRNLEIKKSRLVDLYTDGSIDKDYLKDKLIPVSSRIKEINSAINIYENYENIGIDVEKYVKNFIKRIEVKEDNIINNVFLKTIFKKFIVNENGNIDAILNIDYNTDLSMKIPFGEMVDDGKKLTVPNLNNSTQRCDRETSKIRPVNGWES